MSPKVKEESNEDETDEEDEIKGGRCSLTDIEGGKLVKEVICEGETEVVAVYRM